MRISVFLSLALLVCCALGLHGSAQNNAVDPSQRLHGIELYNQKKYGEAAELLKQTVKQNKSDADAWYYLGLALLQNPKSYKDSSKAFETATKLRPNFADAHAGFAYLLLIRNKNDDAAREARAALALDTNNADAYYVLGMTRLRAGAKEEALQDAETAIRLRPQIAPAYLLKSQALVTFLSDDVLSSEAVSESKKNRLREAAEALEKYLQLIPNDSNRATWVQQLESLRVHANTAKPGEKKLVFTGREVTSKARVISRPEPLYTEEARANRVTGKVVLRCVVTTDGVVRHCLIVKALPFGLTEQSLNCARKTKLVPAMIDGQPVNMYLQLEYDFHLY